jgi:hypothetical protein
MDLNVKRPENADVRFMPKASNHELGEHPGKIPRVDSEVQIPFLYRFILF